MKARNLAIGVVILGILKLVFALLRKVIEFLSYFLVYFGLYVPFFYLIYGVVIINVFNINLDGYSTELGLYIFGLVLSCIASVAITVNNWTSGKDIKKPLRRRIHAADYFKKSPRPLYADGYDSRVRSNYPDEATQRPRRGSDFKSNYSDGNYFYYERNGKLIVEDEDHNIVYEARHYTDRD